MAARGLLTPFYFHNKATASPFVLNLPTYIKGLRGRGARFFCSHRHTEIDMSKYREKFAQRMAMAGLKPHHRIAIAVSGGPDSIALCVLTAGWKSDHFNAATNGRSKSVNNLLAIVVDHGLRTESAEEADLVRQRVLDMGIKCEVARCEWLDGKPKCGHLQEAARNKRYETLQRICLQQQVGVLLIAHHADDQAELFILRLSRNSGVLGLAGMAFTSHIFSEFPDFSGEVSKTHGILLVRPLLEYSKEDMYNICKGGNQLWVEDPTNRSSLYARNRIRMSLNSSSSVFKAELQAVVAACRRTRVHVQNFCHLLLNQTVTIMPHGYAMIDLVTLQSMEVKDIYLAKFAALVVQFISQRHKPVRGNGLKLLMGYLRTIPSKTCLTVAGGYLCPAPGSKGNKVLVCCSSDMSSPPDIKLCHPYSHRGFANSELEKIARENEANFDKFVADDASSVPFLDATSSESVLIEAKRSGILSNSSHETIVSLQKQENEKFKAAGEEAISDRVSQDNSIICSGRKLLHPGQVGYFMNRYVVDWKGCNVSEGRCCCMVGDEMAAEVRHMVDADWMYLHGLSKKIGGDHMDYAVLAAGKALVSLKSIPIAARRSMPVLVNSQRLLLSIPSIGFSCCPHLKVSAVFHPRIPLGGGHTSFL